MGYQEENGLAMKRLSETDQLESRLDALGGSIRKQYLLEGFLKLFGYGLFGLVFLFVLDFLTHMPFVVRLCLLLGGIITGIVWFIKNFFKKYQVKLTTEEVSLMVEKSNPTLQSRMISTLQFQATNDIKPGTSENLVEGLVNQTFQMISDVKWSNAIDKKWVKKTMQMLAIGGGLFLLSCLLGQSSFAIFFKRFVSSEAKYPTKTKIVSVTFDGKNEISRIAEGEKIIVKVTAQGEIPPMGKLNLYAVNSGGESEYDLKFDEANKIFFCELDPILEDINVTITLGDDNWGPKTIMVIPRPKIITLDATITPPKYTGLEVLKEKAGNLQVFEGSTIEFAIKSDKDLTKLELVDFSKQEAKTAFTSKDGKAWTGTFKPAGNTKYTFQLVDKENLESRGVPIFTISVINDKAPTFKILKPDLITQGAPVTKIPMKIQIQDDFMVVGVRIMAQIMERNANGEEIKKADPKKIFEELKLNRKLADIKGFWDLANISSVKVVPGNIVRIWLEAWDNHEPEPLLMKSQEVSVTILSVEEYNSLLMSRFENFSKSVEDVIVDMKASERDIIDINK